MGDDGREKSQRKFPKVVSSIKPVKELKNLKSLSANQQSEIFKEKPAEIHRLQKGTKHEAVVAVKDHTRFPFLVDAGGPIWSGLPIICQKKT